MIPKNIPSGNDQEFASEHGHRNGESFHENLIFFSYINVYQRVAFGHIRHGENKYWTKRLFTEAYFGSAMYKGSAKQTLALMSLLRWVCESAWLGMPNLQTAASCFLKLCSCVECIRTICHTRCFDRLHALQTEHQKAFVEQWGDFVRPKHHHRLHLPF